jgi:hypothetical protein
METLELCSGYGSFSRVARKYGHSTFTVDIDVKYSPDMVADILTLPYWRWENKIDVLWISPPCTEFSRAYRGFPSEKAIRIFRRAFELRDLIKPRFYIIENPVGRAEWFISERYETVYYCTWGFKYPKPTRLWTNVPIENRACAHRYHMKMSECEHSADARGAIPDELLSHILRKCNERINLEKSMGPADISHEQI